MTDESAFTSDWISAPGYCIIVTSSALPASVLKSLETKGFLPLRHTTGMHYLLTGPAWSAQWQIISALLGAEVTTEKLLAAIVPGEDLIEAREIGFHLRPWREIDAIAEHLWLAEALRDNRLVSFMQRVVDRRGKQIGYEAFARIEQENGDIIGGGAIMQASHALRIEFQLDRLMHKQVVRNYVEGDLDGYLFINFLTGFIHRPEVYLEGLSRAVAEHHLLSRFVVLDVPVPTQQADHIKLAGIAQYCRARGFAVALDDVDSPQGLDQMLAVLKPGFVKLDARLSKLRAPIRNSMLNDIVTLSHSYGAMVLAEAVEDEELHNFYLASGVDLFQGYLFGKPERRHPKSTKARSAS